MTTPLTLTLAIEPLTVAIENVAMTSYPLTLTHRVMNLVGGSTVLLESQGFGSPVVLTLFNERQHLFANFLFGTADGVIIALPIALVCFGLLVIRRAMIAAGGGSGGGRW